MVRFVFAPVNNYVFSYGVMYVLALFCAKRAEKEYCFVGYSRRCGAAFRTFLDVLNVPAL